MKLLFDTSTLIAAVVARHPNHRATQPWLDRVLRGQEQGIVAAHSLAELYAKLTSIPFTKRKITGQEALTLIEHNIRGAFQIVPLTAGEYISTIERLAQGGLSGGIVYDALIMRAGVKAGADRFLTLNASHFRRVDPEYAHLIFDPAVDLP